MNYSKSLMATVVIFVASIAICDLRKGEIAPAFSLNTVDGRVISLEFVKGSEKKRLKVTLTSVSLDGKKVRQELKFKLLLIDFSTTWCLGCHSLREVLKNLWKKYSKKGLLIIAVYDDESGPTRAYAKLHKIPYIVAIDNNSKVTTSYKVEAYPTVYLVDTSGTVVSVPDDYSEASLTKIVESFGIK
ncbi:MAG: TlpA disulfide reductase family protein [Armatimonadota bacterium]|nr:TlpA family protein disulfide reductase [Armatimonadota bacterium]MCX7778041.1 TlpA family protein disulfide reductase [Armatimonadota bacterium]MDW8024961.1 TlpA disulfide reductase family protein [Armatimonadota bacterium]